MLSSDQLCSANLKVILEFKDQSGQDKRGQDQVFTTTNQLEAEDIAMAELQHRHLLTKNLTIK